MATYSPSPADTRRSWHLIDAKDQVLGRLATRIAANPRLYLGRGVNTGYFIMARGEQFPTRDANSRYALSGTHYWGIFKGNPSTYKALRSIEFHYVVDADATRYWTPQYLLDKGAATAFNQQGTNNRVTATGWQAKYVVDSSGNALQAMGRQFELRLGYTSASNSHPPELELPAIVRFTEFPDHVTEYNALLLLPSPNKDGQPASTQMNNLRELIRTDASTDTALVLLEKMDDFNIGYSGGPTGSVGINVILTDVQEVVTIEDDASGFQPGSIIAFVSLREWQTA